MKRYFNVLLEFDTDRVDAIILSTIKNHQKGYVCAIESNNLAYANHHPDFMDIVNNALVNICDGSNIAWLLNKIHHKPFRSYIGSDLFLKYVHMRCYKQYFLGNTALVLNGLRDQLTQIDPAIQNMPFDELPFCAAKEFDYESIGQKINRIKPDIIWVSLGAPKQEQFMNLLLPHIEHGVMFGIGAAFNFNAGVGKVKRAPQWMRKLRLEWLYRAFEEPRKNIPRYWNFLKIMPILVWHEMQRKDI